MEYSHVSILCIWYDRVVSKAAGEQGSTPPSQRKNMSDADIQNWRNQRAETILERAKTRQVSSEFSAPQFCRDWIQLANKTTRANRLKIMARTVKKDNNGRPVISKRTKLPLLEWTPYE
ncbi:hypothetical protein ACBP93_08425 [Paenalcaligenes hominis]|uniref:hypothetical protein n=1 Tax=Paenalcaligenes hominis TaxID=643674 RepID=UPI003523C208